MVKPVWGTNLAAGWPGPGSGRRLRLASAESWGSRGAFAAGVGGV